MWVINSHYDYYKTIERYKEQWKNSRCAINHSQGDVPGAFTFTVSAQLTTFKRRKPQICKGFRGAAMGVIQGSDNTNGISLP